MNVIEVSSIFGHKELRMLKRYKYLNADNLVSRLSYGRSSPLKQLVPKTLNDEGYHGWPK
jgi:hypothetical protein